MNMPVIKYCPGNLTEGHESYSQRCLKNMFFGRKVSHVLPYNAPRFDSENTEEFIENRKRISISGVQEKLSLILDKNKLRLTHEGEQGNYILKPIPIDLKNVDQVPANEHLTMQIAKQVYGINTAQSALVFFKNGEAAYITKRFDVKEDGSKWAKEDFASLAGKTTESAGFNFKYDYSYEELASLVKEYVPTYIIELGKLFSLIVFNYLFSNGDAHLKNFSLLETFNGDFTLSPAYDLINTRIHIDDIDFALDHGLFADGFQSKVMKLKGYAGVEDFYEFAKRLGIKEKRRDKILGPFIKKQEKVEQLITHSFLSDKMKKTYLMMYQTRRNRLLE